jgi:hypothetical protein
MSRLNGFIPLERAAANSFLMRRSNLAIIVRPNEIVPNKHNRVLIAGDHPVVREGSNSCHETTAER